MTNISQETIKLIKKNQLKPKPRWEFIFKNSLIWGLFALALMVEGVLVSVVIEILSDHDFDIYGQLGKNIFEYTLIVLPYFWLIVLAIIIGLAVYNFYLTKRGYRIHRYVIVLVSMAGGVLIGTLFYYIGLGYQVDETLARKMPYYNRMVMRKPDIWCRPDFGLLAGEITEVVSPAEFLLRDFRLIEWTMRGEQMVWRVPLPLQPQLKVKVIGQSQGDHIFIVQEVRPWGRGFRPMPAPMMK